MICVLAIMFLSGILLEGKKLYSFVVIDVLVFIVLTVLLVSGTFDGTIMESFKDIWFINMLTTQICAIGLLFLTHIIYKTLEKQAKSIKVSKDLIQKSEKKYRSTFTYAGLGIFNLSLEENITNANIKCCETLGYSIYELKKLIFKEIIFIGDVDIFEEMLSKAKNKEGKHSNSEIRCNQKNGEIIWANITIVYVENTTNKSMSFICTIEDITGKKNLAKKNLSLELHLRGQQRLESIGTLASGIAHEINNPINGILNYGQIILDTDSIETDIKEYAGEIIHESNRISEIVKNLLSFSRQSNQAHSYANIEDIISQTMSLIKAVMRHDQIELTISIDEDLPQIKCRSQQLQQVIMNLLTNAQDALNEKYPEYDENKIINISCTNINLSGRNWLKLTIEDFGCGIPKSILQKIFDPFFTTKGKDKGTGLGLSISYGIIKEHHGEMTVETEENEYTRFILRLPCDNGWTLNK